MTFRRSRWSNDFNGWIFPILSAPAALITTLALCFALTEDKISIAMVFGSALFAVLFVGIWACSIFRLVKPFEIELVADLDCIRQGRVNLPNRQNRLKHCEIRKIVVDKREGEIFADINRISLKPIGSYILNEASTAEFLAFIRERHPEIPIVDSNAI